MNATEEQRARLQRKLGRLFKRAVPDTPELGRIAALPRRIWEQDEIEGIGGIDELVQAMTGYLKQRNGQQTLWPVQAKALQESHDQGGLFGPIPVGLGKTLITFLAPVVMEARWPLLVVPARLRDKTSREFIELRGHWLFHPDIRVVSYEKISREGGTLYLRERHPDLLVFDEVHRLKNREAAVTRRFEQWFETYPHTKCIALSGTITKRSLLDFAHVLRWCLPPPWQPLPQFQKELEAWAAAVDVIRPHEQRVQGGVGALVRFCNDQERTQGRDGVRSALRRRIQETPGVVACQAKGVEASLNIELRLIEGYNDRILGLARGLLEGLKPNGDPITDNDLGTAWRNFRTLTSGFWYQWDPPPPEVWLQRRRAWKGVVRAVLDEHRPGLESEALVAKAAKEDRLEIWQKRAYLEWLSVRSAYEPQVVPVWEDERIIEEARTWSRHHRGIIWVCETALGERLEKDLRLPYFHRMGLDRAGRPIESADPKDGCIVASVGSNNEGRNLQAWAENLVITPMPTGNDWEQLLGRTHRPGQDADEVWVEVLFGCKVEWECWCQAMVDARYATKMEGEKKLVQATVDRTFEIPSGRDALWAA
jgi:hypothetical protein